MINNLPDTMRPYFGNFITIDPGSAGTGIAFFMRGRIPPVIAYSILADEKQIDWMKQCDLILDKTKMHLLSMSEGTKLPVFIEEPQFFSSYKGVTAAKDGSLAKLIFFFGRVWGICETLKLVPYAVGIQQWKGQLSKQQVIKRIEKKIGFTYDSHAADAVGIGLYMRGIL